MNSTIKDFNRLSNFKKQYKELYCTLNIKTLKIKTIEMQALFILLSDSHFLFLFYFLSVYLRIKDNYMYMEVGPYLNVVGKFVMYSSYWCHNCFEKIAPFQKERKMIKKHINKSNKKLQVYIYTFSNKGKCWCVQVCAIWGNVQMHICLRINPYNSIL